MGKHGCMIYVYFHTSEAGKAQRESKANTGGEKIKWEVKRSKREVNRRSVVCKKLMVGGEWLKERSR